MISEIDILSHCFSHRELARMYLIRLKETEQLKEELKQCKAELQAERAGKAKDGE